MTIIFGNNSVTDLFCRGDAGRNPIYEVVVNVLSYSGDF